MFASTSNPTIMDTKSHPLHILFFPFMAHGHLLPMADIVRLFSIRGVKCTILTTPSNEPIIRPTIDRANEAIIRENEKANTESLVPISISLIPFPCAEVGLPPGTENAADITSPDIRERLMRAISLLEKPLEDVLKKLCADAFVTDTFLSFSANVAERLSIPRLIFNGTGLFAHCVSDKILSLTESLPTDVETVSIPGLPHPLELSRTQILDPIKHRESIALQKENREADAKSYGEIINSFSELEHDYAVHWREVVGRKTWLVGPVAPNNEGITDKSCRGGSCSSIGAEELLRWLDSKRPKSVIYVSFGSFFSQYFSNEQLREIALGLQLSNRDFIWVVKLADKDGSENWMPREFEEWMKREKKGLIIQGWAPQVPILNHQAIGGFVTHCGWNSTLEAISAGVPMITWPLSHDQFYNEKLVVDILRVGAGVGVKQNSYNFGKRQFIDANTITNVIETVMSGGEEGDSMKMRAEELKEKARKTVQEGGSSYIDLNNLLDELKTMRDKRVSTN